MEGQKRALHCYQKSYLDNFKCRGVCNLSQQPEEKQFLGTVPSVKQALPPELLIWENVGEVQRNYWKRLSLKLALFTLTFIGLVILLIVLNAFSNISEDQSEECFEDDIPTLEESYADYLNNPTDTHAFDCYCMDQQVNKGLDVTQIQFPDAEYHCQTWYYLEKNRLLYVYGAALLITVVGMIASKVLEKITEIGKPIDKNVEALSNLIITFVYDFINDGVLVFLVNLNLGISLANFPIFAGPYTKLDVFWYREIGSTIVLTMIFNIFSPHLTEFISLGILEILKCRDRSWTCDKRRTKQITQKQYEEINTGPEFPITDRYSQIITLIWLTLMFSSGLPLLYPIAMCTVFLMYWVDKITLLRVYKNPLPYTYELPMKAMRLFKYAIVTHFIIGLYMYSNVQIIPPAREDSTNALIEASQHFTTDVLNANESLALPHMLIFLTVGVICVAGLLFKSTIGKVLVRVLKDLCKVKTKIKEAEMLLSDDFYKQIPFQTIYFEYKKSLKEHQDLKEMLKKKGAFPN
mmetsp:Transcript_7230/g.6337  ORF Transcript_7230/g.6337 Transcript_7230/m.6337 type:complete len:521 (+) Transcript_7230:2062-3624(+)